MAHKPVLVVGAGFAGAVHARCLAEAGVAVHVIDRRPHIAGNAHDALSQSGVRVHSYGPHLFHTNMGHVVDWLSRFGQFTPYEHRVQAVLADGRAVPLPINRTTINTVFGTRLETPGEVAAFLARLAISRGPASNAAEDLAGRIGTRLTDLFFRPYTAKMWGRPLEDLSPEVTRRIPLRLDDEDRYFPDDRFQLLPSQGYTALFASILDHPCIRVSLNTPFDPAMRASHGHCFNSMAIDEFYGERFGPLPYRSIRFHHREVPLDEALGTTAVVNFTDHRPHTRQTDWSRLPGHAAAPGSGFATRTVTLEEPCDYLDNGRERYYPIKTPDGRNEALYARYRALADADPHLSFIGRCGTYQYLDMHQVINQSLTSARTWLARNHPGAG